MSQNMPTSHLHPKGEIDWQGRLDYVEARISQDLHIRVDLYCREAIQELFELARRIETLEAENAAALNVIAAARCIRHWHNTGRNDEGTIVSSEKVLELWKALEEFDSARQAAPEVQG